MTVSVPGSLTYSYAGNGSTTAFAYPVRFLENAEVVVVLEDSLGGQTVKTITTHYTVTGAGEANGGTVTMLTAPASGETLYIYRDTAKKQVVDLTDSSRNPAQSVEDQLDRLAMAAQDIGTVLGRAVVNRVGGTGITVPAASDGKALKWSSGILVNTTYDPDTQQAAAAASAAAALAAQTAAEGARDSTLAAFDSFDDRYLGAKASDPALDNDGNALVSGALYYNTATGMKLWNGSAWVAAYVSGDEYMIKTGDTATGKIAFVASAAGYASIRIQAGVAPSAPVDGDEWGTTTGRFARINGTTLQYMMAASVAALTSFEGVSWVAGDLPYASGTDTFSRLAKGTAGQFLVMNAGATGPEWSSASIADAISGMILLPTAKDYLLVVKAPFAGTITETVTKCVSGTATATFKVNTTALGGTANSVSSTEQAQAHAASNTFIAGDDIVVTVSAVSSCVDFSYTIKFTRALA